jgi:hypothetical protein
VRQPGGVAGGPVNVNVVSEASIWVPPLGIPHTSHFRGTQRDQHATRRSTTRRPTNGTAPRSGTGTTTTGSEVQIDGAYVIHLGNVVATRVAVPFNGAIRFAADPAGGGRFTLFTDTPRRLTAPGIDRRARPVDQGHRGPQRSDRAGARPRLDADGSACRAGSRCGDLTPGVLDVNVDGFVTSPRSPATCASASSARAPTDVTLIAPDGSILDG